jgi:serine protease Do
LFQQLAREADALERHFSLVKKVVKLVRPSVVHIESDREEIDNLSRRRRQVEEAGSGVIIESGEKFFVLTNRHVIKRAALSRINIKFADGRQVHPVKLWSDAGTDIAVMQISQQRLIPARLGDSSRVEIGDFVLAFGSPFGLSHSATYGIVSAKGRRDLELGDDGVRYQDFLQTDAAINPGNSGGPLLNLRGQVIGINTAIASSSGGNEGIGFAIPINMVMIIARQLIENGRVQRAFLGVHLDSKFGPEAAARLGLPTFRGARISGITPKSPAENSDLKVGDVILTLDGIPIEDDSDLVNRVSLTPVGKEIAMTVFRDGKQANVIVKVGDRNSFDHR